MHQNIAISQHSSVGQTRKLQFPSELSHPLRTISTMSSNEWVHKEIRIKRHEAVRQSNAYRLTAGSETNEVAQLLSSMAELLYDAWAKGWRRSDGSMADEFVFHMWFSAADGHTHIRGLSGLDAKIPEHLDEWLEQKSDPERPYRDATVDELVEMLEDDLYLDPFDDDVIAELLTRARDAETMNLEVEADQHARV